MNQDAENGMNRCYNCLKFLKKEEECPPVGDAYFFKETRCYRCWRLWKKERD